MLVLELAILAFLYGRIAVAAPAAAALQNQAQCASLGQRKAWYVKILMQLDVTILSLWNRHTFSNAEKTAYINAELCLMSKPAKLQVKGVKTRFDDFQAIHQGQAYANHFVVSRELDACASSYSEATGIMIWSC